MRLTIQSISRYDTYFNDEEKIVGKTFYNCNVLKFLPHNKLMVSIGKFSWVGNNCFHLKQVTVSKEDYKRALKLYKDKNPQAIR